MLHKIFYAQNRPNPHDYTPFPTGTWGFDGVVEKIISVPYHYFYEEGIILCVGSFTSYTEPGGAVKDVPYFVCLDVNFKVVSSKANFNNRVNDVILLNDESYIVIGGRFTSRDGNTCQGVCFYGPNDVYTEFTTGITGSFDGYLEVRSIAESDNLIHICGSFLYYKGDVAKGYAAFIGNGPKVSDNLPDRYAWFCVRTVKSGSTEYVLLSSPAARIRHLKVGTSSIEFISYINGTDEVYDMTTVSSYGTDVLVYGTGTVVNNPRPTVKIEVNSDDTVTLNNNWVFTGATGSIGDVFPEGILKLDNDALIIKVSSNNFIEGGGSYIDSSSTFQERVFILNKFGGFNTSFGIIYKPVVCMWRISPTKVLMGGYSSGNMPRGITRVNIETGEDDV